MTVHSLLVAAWRKRFDAQVPTTDFLTRWCYETFAQVPSQSLAIKIRETLLALSKEDNDR